MDAVRGQLYSDTRVRTVGGEPLHGQTRLPELPDVEQLHESFFDRSTRLFHDNRRMSLGGMGVGALFGVASTRGVFGRLGGGLLGASLGALAAMSVTAVANVVSGRSSTSTQAHVRDVPGATSTPRTGETGEHLRVMDWNIHQLTGHEDIGFDPEALDGLAATVERERPDVLVLQEVSQGAMEAGGKDQLAILAERLGATDAVLVPNGMRPDGGRKGNAVFTFGDAAIQDARGLRMPDPEGSGVLRRSKLAIGLLEYLGIDVPARFEGGYFPRTPGDVIVTTAGGTDVRVVDVHLSGTGMGSGGTPGSTSAMERQLVPLAATLDAWEGRTILSGDFNVRGGTTEHDFEERTLNGAGLDDVATTLGIEPGSEELRSWPSYGPAYKGIDRMYVSDGLRPVQMHVVRDADAIRSSDHLPVVTDMVVD
ncbi:MAG: endonuclease/exonuclease/phosphatase family protein [Thermoleophilia bacterium]|nr:endonuclease/exonuclease/phosphatase family protein [Thermoleophilia bacterium]